MSNRTKLFLFFFLSCSIYLAPYHLYDGFAGPPFDRRCTYAAIGMLFACITFGCITQYQRSSRLPNPALDRPLAILSIAGWIPTAFLENLDIPWFVMGDVEHGPSQQLYIFLSRFLSNYITDIECLLIVGSQFTATLGLLHVLSTTHSSEAHFASNGSQPVATRKRQPLPGIGVQVETLLAEHAFIFPTLVLIAAAAAGFATKLSWYGRITAPYGFPAPTVSIASTCISLVLSASIGLLVIMLAIRFSLMACVRHGNGHHTLMSTSIPCFTFLLLSASSIAWFFSSRVMPASAIPAPVATALAVTVLTGLICLHVTIPAYDRLRCRQINEGVRDKTQRARRQTATALDRLNFSPREHEYALKALEGAALKEIAYEAGVNPSTVRVTLHRAYRKANVANLKELKARLAYPSAPSPSRAQTTSPSTATSSAAPATVHRSTGTRHETLLSTCRILGWLIAFSVLVPSPASMPRWGYGTPILVGSALGMVAFDLLAWLREGARAVGRPPLFAAKLARFPYESALITAGGALVLPYLIGAGTSIAPIIQLAALCGSMLIALGAIRAGTLLLNSDSFPALIELAGAALISAQTRILGMLPVVLPFACLILTGLLVAICLTGSVPIDIDHPSRVEAERPRRTILWQVIALGALAGFLYEELWRSAGTSSFSSLTIPFALSVLISGVLFVLSSRHSGILAPDCQPARTLVLFLALTATSFLSSGMSAFLLIAALLACTVLRRAASGPSAPPRHGAMAAAGGSAAAALVLVNKIQDQLLAPNAATHLLFESADALLAVSWVLLGACSLAGGPLLASLLKRLSNENATRAFLNASTDSSVETRTRALLIAHGLTDVQVELIVETLKGASTLELAKRFSYAPSTIKALRSATYRQLGVKGEQDLLALISEVIAL